MSNQSSAGQKAARAASAAVNIARGAAAGGVYGAAVEAAKSFLPELIRLFVILLCVVLLVPMLVFTALPNILFGYSSSTDQDISKSGQLPAACGFAPGEQYSPALLVRWRAFV